jgi:hypothetical protein
MRVQITEAMTALTDPTTNEPYVLGEWAAVSQTEAQRLRQADDPNPVDPPKSAPAV